MLKTYLNQLHPRNCLILSRKSMKSNQSGEINQESSSKPTIKKSNHVQKIFFNNLIFDFEEQPNIFSTNVDITHWVLYIEVIFVVLFPWFIIDRWYEPRK